MQKQLWVLVVLLAACAWTAVHVALLPYLTDDSYIHLRVAENFASSGLPYFNAGEPLKTCTSTTWLWLLSALAWLAPGRLGLVAALSALISLAAVGAFLRLVRSLVGRALRPIESVSAAVLFLSCEQMASLTAMESPLALLLLCLGLDDYCHARPRALALLVLAACTRPELGIVLLLVSLVGAASRRALPWRSLCWAGAAAAGPCLFDLVAYGTIVPQAMVAKPLIHRFSSLEASSMLQPEAWLHEFQASGLGFVVYATLAVVVATLPILSLPWSRKLVDDRALQVVCISAAAGLSIALLYVLSGSLIFPWYRPLYFVPLFLPALALGLRYSSSRTLGLLTLAALPLLYDLGGSLLAAAGQGPRLRHFLEGARARHSLAVARALYRSYPTATLMTSEIGALGYGFRGHIADTGGLASAGVLAYYPLPVPDERLNKADFPVPWRFVELSKPGLVVAVDRHVERLLRGPVGPRYVHVRLPLFEPDDEARRASEELLWDSVRYLEVLVRKDLWLTQHPSLPGPS